jgi:hypothetical protein
MFQGAVVKRRRGRLLHGYRQACLQERASMKLRSPLAACRGLDARSRHSVA